MEAKSQETRSARRPGFGRSRGHCKFLHPTHTEKSGCSSRKRTSSAEGESPRRPRGGVTGDFHSPLGMFPFAARFPFGRGRTPQDRVRRCKNASHASDKPIDPRDYHSFSYCYRKRVFQLCGRAAALVPHITVSSSGPNAFLGREGPEETVVTNGHLRVNQRTPSSGCENLANYGPAGGSVVPREKSRELCGVQSVPQSALYLRLALFRCSGLRSLPVHFSCPVSAVKLPKRRSVSHVSYLPPRGVQILLGVSWLSSLTGPSIALPKGQVEQASAVDLVSWVAVRSVRKTGHKIRFSAASHRLFGLMMCVNRLFPSQAYYDSRTITHIYRFGRRQG